jgi:hypothetical protein
MMPSPRNIAKQVNDSSLFEEPAYDADAGVPPGVASQGAHPDYAANPVNPPDPPAPAKNLKS